MNVLKGYFLVIKIGLEAPHDGQARVWFVK